MGIVERLRERGRHAGLPGRAMPEGGLVALLAACRVRRTSGRIVLRDHAGEVELFVLDGHLIHAADPMTYAPGEDVVVAALRRAWVTHSLDRHATPPSRETVRVGLDRLRERARG